jgi:tRNA dimethylallyltransferase
MSWIFFIVGPTATGKSAIAAEVARVCGGEVVSVDAFQIYRGLDLLTAKPEQPLLDLVPHHLIDSIPLAEEMNAELFCVAARGAIQEIHARGKPAFVVGGSGLYVKALTDGLSPLPPANAGLRERLNELSEHELLVRLCRLDPESARTIDSENKRRLVRAVEICLLSGRPASEQRQRPEPRDSAAGVLLLRDRADLYQRINSRVEMIFANGVVDEVRAIRDVGPTAAKTIGLSQIRDLIAGRLSERECIASIQQATRRYAKRQLTWFQRQTSLGSLNLSHHGSSEAIEWIARKARLSFAQRDD